MEDGSKKVLYKSLPQTLSSKKSPKPSNHKAGHEMRMAQEVTNECHG